MKNIINKGCLFFVLITLLVSCGSKKPVVVKNETTTKDTITETVHDTIFKIEKDSSYYQALLDCQDGKVVVKNVSQSEPGRTLKSPKVRLRNNILQVDCEAKAQELFAKWKSTYKSKTSVITKEVPVVTNVLTWWQQTQIYLFRILAVLFLFAAMWYIIKPKF